MPTPIRVEFDVKHFEAIAASMMNYLSSVQSLVTDFNIGSINRTLLESVAMELEEIYYRLYKAIEKAIPEALYTTFDFDRLPATAAVGTVTFSRATAAPQNYLIPEGTILATVSGIEFAVLADATLPSGSTSVGVQVRAVVPGASGNVAANSITVMRSVILGVDAVTNAAALTGGADLESDDARKARFQAFISSLARAPVNGVEAGARTTTLIDPVSGNIVERVQVAKLDEPFLTDSSTPAGVATLYIDNGAGSASTELVAQCQKIIDGYIDPDTQQSVIGYKAAGVVIQVKPVTAQLVTVDATVFLMPGATADVVRDNLKATAANFFSRLGIGEEVDRERLLASLMVVQGVRTLILSSPQADVQPISGGRAVIAGGSMLVTIV